MSHRIYTTEGVVMRRFPDEEDCFYLIFTKELGLVRSYAQGVRKVDSKLKFALQEYSLLDVSFVRGKSGWRITSALPIMNLYKESNSKENIRALGNIVSTTTRLVSGEEKNDNLYKSFSSGLKNLIKTSSNNLRFYEILIMFRILYFLGYIDGKDFEDILVPEDFDLSKIDFVRNKEKEIIFLVNKAIKESQL